GGAGPETGRNRPDGNGRRERSLRRLVRGADAGEPESLGGGDEVTGTDPSPPTALSLTVMTPPLVAIRALRVVLCGHPILSGVTAEVARGKITALIGLNGSGKTTLLRAVVGEYAYRGEVKFRCGHDHSKPNPEHVGYV